jgi:hypothetical protein
MRETFPERPFRLFEVDMRTPDDHADAQDADAERRRGQDRRALERA